ncbi:MAG: tripartite tricarboxylate transporter TctB family protein [Vicinamibacterales bacterium]
MAATESPAKRSGSTGQLAVAAAVLVLGVLLAVGTMQLPEATGYAKVGPKLVPTIVSGALMLLGVLLLREAWFGGFHDVDEAAAATNPTEWKAFAWISGAMIVNGLLMVPAGFVIAGIVMFVMAARGFGSTRWVHNAIIGAIIAAITYAFFNYGLGLNLPLGLLPF